MSNYAHKLFHGFLKKQPQFCWPASLRDTPPELDDLKPTLSCVELHRHGNELVVVVEGSNLWFSYQTSLHRTQKIHIYGEESYGTFIKYILPGDHEDKVVVESGKVTVCLQTHFSLQPVKQLVTVHKKVMHTELLHMCIQSIFTICTHFSILITEYRGSLCLLDSSSSQL